MVGYYDEEVKCSHGVPLFKNGARCIDCEIGWERQMLHAAEGRVALSKLRIVVLEEEKRWKSGEMKVEQAERIGMIVTQITNIAEKATLTELPKMKAVDLNGIERECCGTFHDTPHRNTCEKWRGKKMPNMK